MLVLWAFTRKRYFERRFDSCRTSNIEEFGLKNRKVLASLTDMCEYVQRIQTPTLLYVYEAVMGRLCELNRALLVF